MHFTDLVRADAKIYSRAVPKFLPTLSRDPKPPKRKSKTSVPSRKRTKRSTVAKLSEINAKTANAIFKLHDLETTDFSSVFILMKLDLQIMFPKLPCFVEERSWLSWIGRPPSPDSSYGTVIECDVITDRLLALSQASDAYGARKDGCLSPLGFVTARSTWRELFSKQFPMEANIPRGQAGHAAQLLEAKLLLEPEVFANMANNQYTNMVPFKVGGDLVFVAAELAARPTILFRPALVQPEPSKPESTPKEPELACNSFPKNKLTILQVSAPVPPLGITFREALWLVQSCAPLKPSMFKKFIQQWERVLIPSKQWRAALCLLSAVKISTFSKYLGHLRRLLEFINKWFLEPIQKSISMEVLVDLIKKNELEEEILIQFAQYRTTRVKFQTVRANFTAISFFYRHLPERPIFLWEDFTKLKVLLQALGNRFLEEAEGSIFLEWKHIKIFLLFTLTFTFSDVDSQVIFDCFILAYWFALRISEACKLWFLNIRILPATNKAPEKLQLCVVDSKTNNRKTPWHLVTLNALPEKEWKMFCPVEAYRRILKRRKNSAQNRIFVRSDGKAFTKDWLSKTFRLLRKAFIQARPDIVSRDDKFTFHVFRISVLGFYIKDMGFTLYEAQTISRHKIGSSTTEEVYLAKGKFAFTQSLAHKIQNFIGQHGSMPIADSETDNISLQAEDNLLLYTDSARMAKRYKSFENPTQNQQTRQPQRNEKRPKAPKKPLRVPKIGETLSFPYKVGTKRRWRIRYFQGTLVERTSKKDQQGFSVQFEDNPDPIFIPLPSVLECANT